MRAAGRRLWLVPLVLGLAAVGAWYSARRHAELVGPAVDLSNGRPKLIELGMGACEQCRKMKPVMEQASREFGAEVEVHVLDIRDDANERLAERYHMRVMPLTVLADGAGNEVWRHEGFVDFPELSLAVAQQLAPR